MACSNTPTQTHYDRIYPDPRARAEWYGQTHIDCITVQESDTQETASAPRSYKSAPRPAFNCQFQTLEPGWTSDWQQARAKHFMIVLTGILEIQVSDGSVKRFTAGDVILFEDTWGKGHRAKNAGEGRLTTFIVWIPVT